MEEVSAGSGRVVRVLLVLVALLVLVGLGLAWVYRDELARVWFAGEEETVAGAPPTVEEVKQKAATLPWDYQNTEVSTSVMEVNRSAGRLQLYFSWPPPAPRYSQTAWVEVACDPKTSVVREALPAESNDPADSRVLGSDVLAMAAAGDFLTGKCGDEACGVMATDCVLYKRVAR